MKTVSLSWRSGEGWSGHRQLNINPQLVVFFAARETFSNSACVEDLQRKFPEAHLLGCSSGGQIVGDEVSDDRASAIAMHFERTGLATVCAPVNDKDDSFAAGQHIGQKLARPDLKAVFILSDGLHVNGSQLVLGLRSVIGDEVSLTGGLAGDGAAFERTLVYMDGVAGERRVGAIGLYGDHIRVGHGSAGGWSEFGPKRMITKSVGNVLFEIDGKPALDLYKLYLGDEADGLPGSGLLYPLLVSDPAKSDHAVVRTILAVDHVNSSMTFAGDMPEGCSAQLMRGYFDRLSEAAGQAAHSAMSNMPTAGSETAAIFVSCIGRRILMGNNITEEILAARSALGSSTASTGFYSYGEISPQAESGVCELHNQTMTVTTLSEAL